MKTTAPPPTLTIIEYTDQKPAVRAWPRQIVSPTRASACCATHMQTVGHPHQDARWSYQYKVCRACGFAVRLILSISGDAEAATQLRRSFEWMLNRSAIGG